MKKLLIFAALITLTFGIYAQDKAPKDVNKIIIKTDKSASDNFILVKQVLAENGIEIASQDKDINQIKTGVTPITKYGASAYYLFFCKDNTIVLNGLFNSGVKINVNDSDPFTTIKNKRLGLWGVSFDAMQKLALKLGKNISYETAN